jgi:hypothetical protein
MIDECDTPEDNAIDAGRYRSLRKLATVDGLLEAFVALNQLDYVHDTAKFDAIVDSMKVPGWKL